MATYFTVLFIVWHLREARSLFLACPTIITAEHAIRTDNAMARNLRIVIFI